MKKTGLVNTYEQYLKYKIDILNILNIVGYSNMKVTTLDSGSFEERYYLQKDENVIELSFYNSIDKMMNDIKFIDSNNNIYLNTTNKNMEFEWEEPKELLCSIFNTELRKYKIDNLLTH